MRAVRRPGIVLRNCRFGYLYSTSITNKQCWDSVKHTIHDARLSQAVLSSCSWIFGSHWKTGLQLCPQKGHTASSKPQPIKIHSQIWLFLWDSNSEWKSQLLILTLSPIIYYIIMKTLYGNIQRWLLEASLFTFNNHDQPQAPELLIYAIFIPCTRKCAQHLLGTVYTWDDHRRPERGNI